MFPYCYINGEIKLTDQAFVNINDLGLLRGYAVFDYFLVHRGKPFRIEEHLIRFHNSANGMELKIPVSDEEIKSIIAELIDKNKVTHAGIRLLLTGGNSPDGFNMGKPTFIITLNAAPQFDTELFERGAKLMTHEHKRELPEVKTTNYITAINLQNERKMKNADDILYIHNGKILECIRSNFFIVKDQTIITPKSNMLIGITRNAVVKSCENIFKIEERDILFSELKTADEAFFTSTTKQVTPVVQVDEMIIGNGKVGSVTREVSEIMNRYLD